MSLCTPAPALLLLVALLSSAGGCSGAGDAAAGAACSASDQCSSGICIKGSTCPNGIPYASFCAGEFCEGGERCPAKQTCVDVKAGVESKACIPDVVCQGGLTGGGSHRDASPSFD